jgi:antitoxin (DNA-binding transcriptional repressor) of toxin-antitoxin stability system
MSAIPKRIPATTAAKNFGTLVDRVRDHGTTFIVERHGRAVAQIGPVDEKPKGTLSSLAAYLRTAPRIDEQTLRFIEESVAAANRPAVPVNPWER